MLTIDKKRLYFDASIVMLKSIIQDSSKNLDVAEKTLSGLIENPKIQVLEKAHHLFASYNLIKSYSKGSHTSMEIDEVEFLSNVVEIFNDLYKSTFRVKKDYITNTYDEIKINPVYELNVEF